MNWVSVITLLISFGTLIMVGVELFINTNQKKIDRQIAVTVKERRRMEQDLFKNVIGILEIYRELEYKKFLKEKNILFHEVLNYKVGVWINLNNENSFSLDLRKNCNELATLVASGLETINDDNKIELYQKKANLNRQRIWISIDKYIEEEEKLIKSIVAGEKKKLYKFTKRKSEKIDIKK